jgi:hypothetical protein
MEGQLRKWDKSWRSLHWSSFASVSQHHEVMAFKCMHACSHDHGLSYESSSSWSMVWIEKIRIHMSSTMSVLCGVFYYNAIFSSMHDTVPDFIFIDHMPSLWLAPWGIPYYFLTFISTMTPENGAARKVPRRWSVGWLPQMVSLLTFKILTAQIKEFCCQGYFSRPSFSCRRKLLLLLKILPIKALVAAAFL